MWRTELIRQALRARERAYAPYSNYLVGAAISCINGEIYTGCNIENAAYSVCICGERTALFQAVSQGHREFQAIAVVGGMRGEELPLSRFAYPCGVCRQALMEFSPDMTVIVAKDEPDYKEYKISELLPSGFAQEHLTADSSTDCQ